MPPRPEETCMNLPRLRLLPLVILLLLLLLLSPLAPAATVTFTNAVTISETNASYDGQNLIVSGATVTMDGSHRFNSLLLTNCAVLTRSPDLSVPAHPSPPTSAGTPSA